MQSSSSSQAALLTVCCLLVATEGLDAATSVLDRRISCIADSHYECGRQIGHKAAALIHQNINSNQSQHTLNRIDQWSKLDGGHRLAEYVQAQQDAYPQFIDEIRGIAEGSAVPFETLLRLNLESELTNEAGGSPPHSSGVGKACTDYHVIKQRLWAHNEDGFLASFYKDTTYLVQANITLPGQPSKIYFSFTYPGRLSGWAWGFNANGVVFSVNALTVPPPGNLSSGRLAVNFVARSLLDAASVQDALELASVPGHASGQHVNLASFFGSDGRQLSVETSPAGTTVIDLATIPSGLYAHANQYLHTDRPRLGDYLSSIHRLARAAQWSTWTSPPKDGDDALRFVSDTVDPDYPVYRSNTIKDPEITLCTCLFDLKKKAVNVYVSRATANIQDGSTRTADVRPADAVFSLAMLG